MAIYITGSLVNDQLNYSTGDSNAVRSDLGIQSLPIDIVFTTGNQVISGVKTFVDDTVFGTGSLALLVDENTVNINNLVVSGNSSNFSYRPLVSGVPVLISGDINVSSFITTGQTGDFYPSSNPSGFITGVTLPSYLNSGNIVYTTGNQTVSGIKTFVNQTNVSGLKFNVLSPEQVPDYQQGLVYYSDDNHTLNIYPDVSGLSLQVGQENWVRVKNNLSQTINIGSVVYLTGTNGNNPGFQLSIANSEAGSARTLGVVSNTMLPNDPGYVTTFGIVNGINTSSYTVGQTLYLSTSGSGQFSSLKPTAPNHMVRIGTVLTSKNDGSIFVTVQNGFEVDELHDSQIINPISGQALVYNGNVWTNQYVSGQGGGGESSADIIDLLFKTSFNNYYNELSYNISGEVTGVGVWTNSSKTTQLFSKQLLYSGENLTGIIIIDNTNLKSLTKTLSYDSNDNLISTTRIYN